MWRKEERGREKKTKPLLSENSSSTLNSAKPQNKVYVRLHAESNLNQCSSIPRLYVHTPNIISSLRIKYHNWDTWDAWDGILRILKSFRGEERNSYQVYTHTSFGKSDARRTHLFNVEVRCILESPWWQAWGSGPHCLFVDLWCPESPTSEEDVATLHIASDMGAVTVSLFGLSEIQWFTFCSGLLGFWGSRDFILYCGCYCYLRETGGCPCPIGGISLIYSFDVGLSWSSGNWTESVRVDSR